MNNIRKILSQKYPIMLIHGNSQNARADFLSKGASSNILIRKERTEGQAPGNINPRPSVEKGARAAKR